MPVLLMWGISILTNRYVLMVILAITVVGGIYGKGRLDARHAEQVAALNTKIASMQRDIDAAAKAEKFTNSIIAQLSATARGRAEEIANYEEELKKRPDRCDLLPSDVDRLRFNTGKTKSR